MAAAILSASLAGVVEESFFALACRLVKAVLNLASIVRSPGTGITTLCFLFSSSRLKFTANQFCITSRFRTPNRCLSDSPKVLGLCNKEVTLCLQKYTRYSKLSKSSSHRKARRKRGIHCHCLYDPQSMEHKDAKKLKNVWDRISYY